MKEYEVLLKDGSEIVVLATSAEGALQEAVEQGHYGPVSATHVHRGTMALAARGK